MWTLVFVLLSIYLVAHFGFVNFVLTIRGKGLSPINIFVMLAPAVYLFWVFWLGNWWATHSQ